MRTRPASGASCERLPTADDTRPPYVVGISGASGAVLARHAVNWLADRGHRVIVTASTAAREVWRQEIDEPFDRARAAWEERGVVCYRAGDLAAPIASGSYPVAGMIVVPCSMGTVAAIASGLSSNLLQRAADCCLKEGRRLVLVPRETPLSAVHLENLLKLARLGVRIVPPVPAFYARPGDVDEMVAQIVGRALSALGVPDALDPRFIYRGPGEHTGRGERDLAPETLGVGDGPGWPAESSESGCEL